MKCTGGKTQPIQAGTRIVLLLLAFALFGIDGVKGQFISLKTAPVATGDQFRIFPARNQGMGNLSIAVDDPLGDVFVNPATGARLQGTWAFSSPTYYTITGSDGAARTLPVGALFNHEAWFGGVGVAIQQLETADVQPPVFFTGDPSFDTVVPQPSEPLLRDESSNNQYAWGLVGTRLSESVALAGRVFWAGLEAVDGVDLLYPQSQDIDQNGHQLDVRVGLLGEPGDGRSFEALLLHHRVDMTHDVTYLNNRWDAEHEVVIREIREEHNLDRTNTWGLHLSYVQPIGANDWRLGGILTGNRKSHPKIPNYELMNIPRDPGTSWAYDFGVGLARTYEKVTFGVDFIYEPIFSDTWVEATEPISIPERDLFIDEGEKTLKNNFNFSNTTLRTGVRRDGKWTELQLGLQVHTVRYDLDQQDIVAGTFREQHESWSEWTATWGVGLKLSDLHIRYLGRLTTGTGSPGVATSVGAVAEFAAASDIIVAPRGPLTLQEAKVFTHQLTVSVPINTRDDE